MGPRAGPARRPNRHACEGNPDDGTGLGQGSGAEPVLAQCVVRLTRRSVDASRQPMIRAQRKVNVPAGNSFAASQGRRRPWRHVAAVLDRLRAVTSITGIDAPSVTCGRSRLLPDDHALHDGRPRSDECSSPRSQAARPAARAPRRCPPRRQGERRHDLRARSNVAQCRPSCSVQPAPMLT